MDMKTNNLIDYLIESLNHPDVSGFELLEILDVRSHLASREPLMDDIEKARLEQFDQHLSQHTDFWAERISEVANISKMRTRAHVLPSHWWWYMDQWSFGKQKSALG